MKVNETQVKKEKENEKRGERRSERREEMIEGGERKGKD